MAVGACAIAITHKFSDGIKACSGDWTERIIVREPTGKERQTSRHTVDELHSKDEGYEYASIRNAEAGPYDKHGNLASFP